MNEAIYAPFAFFVLVATAVLSGCDARLTPDQISAIEKVEVAKAAYSRAFQPMLDSMDRCMKERDPDFCGREFAEAPKPSSADYDFALRICIEKGVPSDYCSGKRKYK